MRWIPYVMVRILGSFTMGILAGIFFGNALPEFAVCVIFITLILFYFILQGILAGNYWHGTLAGIVGLPAIALAGCLHVTKYNLSNRPDHIARMSDSIRFYSGTVGTIQRKSNSVKAEVAVLSVLVSKGWTASSGKIVIHIIDPVPITLEAGDQIIIKGTPRPVPGAQNPEEFDLKKYLRFRNVSHQHTITNGQIIMIQRNTYHGFIYWSGRARLWSASILNKWISEPRALAITTALVLGVTDAIDNELQDAYSASGAMHVLSVSGLHVGIIYAIVLLLLKPIRSQAWGRWVVAFIVMLCLWAYAFITGLSPSVLRAVMMFSFVVLAGPFGRHTNIYNTLAASAFLLLLFNPYLIMSVGFQLSYLAVLGIVGLQRPLYQLWETPHLLLDKIWQLTTVSIAAQLATGVMSLYYFHQFPVYFLISNMIVIPVSTAVLISGVSLLVVSGVPYAGAVVAWITVVLVKILNGSVFFIERLPFSTIENVQMSGVQCSLVMAIVIVFILLLKIKKIIYVYIMTLFALIFGAIDWMHFFKEVRKDQLVIYSVQGQPGIVRITNGHATIVRDSIRDDDERQTKYHMKPFFIASGVRFRVEEFSKRETGFQLFSVGGKDVVYLNRHLQRYPLNAAVDYLVIGNNSVSSLSGLKNKIHYKELILTRNNSKTYIAGIIREAKSLGIKFHSVQDNGAFILNFK